MKRFVVLNFLPGAAGNFISRCLNLLTGFHVWQLRESPMPTDINEKLKLLTYESVLNYANHPRKYKINWTRFEHKFIESKDTVKNGEVKVWIDHPSNNYGYVTKEFIDKNDRLFVFYIDPTNMWDWIITSAEIKDSFQSMNWFKESKRMLADPTIHKINLKNIVSNEENFITEFKKICSIIDHQLTLQELDAIIILYNQWKTTTPSDEIVQSKKAEMLALVDRWYKELIDNLNDPRQLNS